MTMYHITGVTFYGIRFKIRTTNRLHAEMINVHRGTLWQVDRNGKRKILRRYGW